MSEIQAAGVGPVLGDAGPPVTFAWCGTTYTLSHPTQERKADLESLVIEYAMEQAKAFPPAMRAEKEEEVTLLIYGGHAVTGGKLWATVNSGPDSYPLLLLSLLRPNHPTLTLAQTRTLWAARPQSLRIALARVLPDFFSLVAANTPGTPDEKAAGVAAAMKAAQTQIGWADADLQPSTPSA